MAGPHDFSKREPQLMATVAYMIDAMLAEDPDDFAGPGWYFSPEGDERGLYGPHTTRVECEIALKRYSDWMKQLDRWSDIIARGT